MIIEVFARKASVILCNIVFSQRLSLVQNVLLLRAAPPDHPPAADSTLRLTACGGVFINFCLPGAFNGWTNVVEYTQQKIIWKRRKNDAQNKP